ncbi:exodeoxyribonuclease VII small subunit [Cyanobium sp. FGCU-52]|nr:exodeoxyribonuclease VII small subunit [Cyanobium sp. FGCU52]
MPRSPRQPKETPDSAESAASAEERLAATLSFRQAQAALELCLAELQAGDLDVEAMAGLYRRALACSARCEALLQQVEQEVMQWDAERPDDAPEPFVS